MADLRAPTPSAAAELAVADLGSILQSLRGVEERLLDRLMEHRLQEKREKLETFSWKLERLSPRQQLLEKQQRLADLEELFRKQMEGKLQEERQRLALLIERLSGASPLKKLNQGYAYVAGEDGKRLTKAGSARIGERLTLYFADGRLSARVEEKGARGTINGRAERTDTGRDFQGDGRPSGSPGKP